MKRNFKPSRRDWLKLLFCSCALMAMTATATPTFNTGDPVGFFTNVADQMLRLSTSEWFQNSPSNYLATYYGINYPFPITVNQFGIVNGLTNAPYFGQTNQTPAFGIANIPVLVNGQFVYSPAMQRLLQVAANIYDASTNRYYDSVPSTNTIPLPTVFQPIFSVKDGDVYITNFVEVTDTSVFTNTIRNLNYGPSVVAALQPNDLVFGVPLIIGAKKGFPNFNEFYMEDTFQLTRKIRIFRSDTNVTVNTAFTNLEMFDVSLNNHFGVECWNSYRTNYTRPTYIYVTNYLTMTLTNDENFNFTTNSITSGFITSVIWSSYNPNFPSASFQIPLATNFPAVPVSIYRFNNFSLPFLTTNLALPFEMNVPAIFGQYPQPHWRLTVTNNLQVIMVDATTGRLIDYVQLNGPNSSRDLTAEIQNGYDTGGSDRGYNNLWNTNINGMFVPIGLLEQLNVSQGNGIPAWSATLWGTSEKSAYDEMNAFRVFMLGKNADLLNYPGYVADPTQIGIAATTNAMQAPYTPTATVVQDVTWQANDPLVHYLASDLNNPTSGIGLGITTNWPANLGKLNQRYMPWGGNPLLPGFDLNPYNLALKDPLVWSSDGWNFPDSQPLNPDLIGQVHRGTPWQTLYLKASNILGTSGINTWINWTGDLDINDAAAMAPVQDRHLASLLVSLLNTNEFSFLLSVNNPDPNAWLVLLNGLTASTNSSADSQVVEDYFIGNVPLYDTIAISSNSPQASILANTIQSARSGQSNQLFHNVGDILEVPQLTEQSPFLNWNDSKQQQYGISDEAYEIIPSQLLSLLRTDSMGSMALINSQLLIQFTGDNGHAYAMQVSSDLLNWVSISTNCPVNGVLSFTNSVVPNANQQFYRSVLLQ